MLFPTGSGEQHLEEPIGDNYSIVAYGTIFVVAYYRAANNVDLAEVTCIFAAFLFEAFPHPGVQFMVLRADVAQIETFIHSLF